MCARRFLRSLLGRRLVLATSGGAALNPAVLAFVRERLRVDLVSLYGTRETGGIARDGVVCVRARARAGPRGVLRG